ncbi:hypothetical protein J7E96_22015 [Streptomyces sp. ISL-96]|uniref:hypothetical protein n=1 Tax=Streptomyces sp. ISL-96 TaxID=2819191 RepID=UPI001BE8A57C|nr:hypothetical protein [Streptomyces sp. ISL-96]MBT2491149.1 hypothetical protein [Streptomyces sp. ISL-96]
MSQPWQPQYNPGNQPPVPPQPPAPPQGFGAPPAPGQFPMQSGYPYQAPYGPRPRSGNPVGAFFLGLLVSMVIAALYSFVLYATYEDLTKNTGLTLYVVHALLNGAAVGAVVGLVGRSSVGARIGGVIVAMLGTFFGDTNGVVLITADTGFYAFKSMMQDSPFYPAEAWWGSGTDGEWHALLGLVAAAAAAWGLAFLIGRSRR